MGVYIKGMEMPKNCFDCMFHWHGDGTTYCLAQSKMHDLHHIKWECKGYEEQMKYREPTCPLVPVPEHGRLIDADALPTDIEWEDILDAPTVIEAVVSEEELQREYEANVEYAQYCERYEPTYDPETGGM